MEQLPEGKIIPWSNFEEFRAFYHKGIEVFCVMEQNQLMTKREIESKLPYSFLKFNQVITTILKNNGLIVN